MNKNKMSLPDDEKVEIFDELCQAPKNRIVNILAEKAGFSWVKGGRSRYPSEALKEAEAWVHTTIADNDGISVDELLTLWFEHQQIEVPTLNTEIATRTFLTQRIAGLKRAGVIMTRSRGVYVSTQQG